MPTLVLSRRHSEDSNSMWRAAVDAGWDVERLQSYAPPQGLAARDPVLYGETTMADALSDSLGLTLLEPAYDWLVRLPESHRKRHVKLASLADVRHIAHRVFAKPVDEKIFPAKVYEAGEVIDAEETFADDSFVITSEPVSFGIEVRAFVRERRIAALSAYIRSGEIAKDSGEWPLSRDEELGAREFLDCLLRDVHVELPPAVVVDVGVASQLGRVVVEANPCWASGLCGCDAREVLPVIRRANVPTESLAYEDHRWARSTHIGTICQ